MADIDSLDQRLIDLELTVLHLLRVLATGSPTEQQRTVEQLAIPLVLRESALVEAARQGKTRWPGDHGA